MSERHTPGPWHADCVGCYVYDKDNQPVAEIRGWGHLSVLFGEERAEAIQIANGEQIAAAPDLLAACKLTKAMFAKCDREGDMECTVPLNASEWQEWETAVNAAIDKAEPMQ